MSKSIPPFRVASFVCCTLRGWCRIRTCESTTYSTGLANQAPSTTRPTILVTLLLHSTRRTALRDIHRHQRTLRAHTCSPLLQDAAQHAPHSLQPRHATETPDPCRCS